MPCILQLLDLNSNLVMHFAGWVNMRSCINPSTTVSYYQIIEELLCTIEICVLDSPWVGQQVLYEFCLHQSAL